MLTASLVTVVLLNFNLLGLAIIANALRHRTLLPAFPGGKPALGAALFVTAALAHQAMSAAWVEGERFGKLARELASSPARERRRTLLFRGYVVFTVCSPIALVMLLRGSGQEAPARAGVASARIMIEAATR